MTFFEQKIAEQIEKDKAYRKKNGFDDPKRSNGRHTIGDFVSAVMKIDNKTDAALFYRGYLEWLSKLPKKEKEGSENLTDEQVAKSNIGWCFGEGMSSKKIEMWNKVTGAVHPIFGTMIPTPEEAVKAGMKIGAKLKK
jgi:hypothetical protein